MEKACRGSSEEILIHQISCMEEKRDPEKNKILSQKG